VGLTQQAGKQGSPPEATHQLSSVIGYPRNGAELNKESRQYPDQSSGQKAVHATTCTGSQHSRPPLSLLLDSGQHSAAKAEKGQLSMHCMAAAAYSSAACHTVNTTSSLSCLTTQRLKLSTAHLCNQPAVQSHLPLHQPPHTSCTH
jgi:hypothetical protein